MASEQSFESSHTLVNEEYDAMESVASDLADLVHQVQDDTLHPLHGAHVQLASIQRRLQEALDLEYIADTAAASETSQASVQGGSETGQAQYVSGHSRRKQGGKSIFRLEKELQESKETTLEAHSKVQYLEEQVASLQTMSAGRTESRPHIHTERLRRLIPGYAGAVPEHVVVALLQNADRHFDRMANRLREIQELGQALAAANNTIAAMERTLVAKDQAVAARGQRIATRDELIAAQDRVLATFRDYTCALETCLDAAREDSDL